MRILIAFALLALTACTPQVRYKTVPVKVTQYVAIPDDWTRPCPIAEPQNDTVAEAVSVAHARKVSLLQCNADKAAIRKLGESNGK